MALSPVPTAELPSPSERPSVEQGWPSPGVARYAVVIFALALMFAELDRNIFNLLIEMVKKDLAISDFRMSLLLGPAVVLFYAFVGIPLARLVDIYPRNVVLAIGIVLWSGMTAVSGLAQNYWQLFVCRTAVGAGGTVHGPGTYSMMADYFPPRKLPRAIAGMQVGYMLGNALAFLLGGAVIALVSQWEPAHLGVLTIRNWQMVLILVGLPGLAVALLVRLLPEPARRGRMAAAGALPFRAVLGAIWKRRGIYGPLFLGLTFSALETYGIRAWLVPFMQRTHGWQPATVAYWMGFIFLVAMPLGIFFGTWLTEHLGRRNKDAPLRVTLIAYTFVLPCAVAVPLMPTGELALIVSGFGTMFGFFGAVPQNAAIQTVTPNEMRGQVTAIYLMIFTIGGALGSVVVASITNFVIGDESKLWLSIAITAAALQPFAILFMSFGLKPYRREIEALEARGLY